MNDLPIINKNSNIKINNKSFFVHGKIVNGKVLNIIQSNFYIISIGKKKFITYSEQKFNIGDYIKAKVKGTFPEITLQLITNNNDNNQLNNIELLLSKLNLLINENFDNKDIFNLIINFNNDKFLLKTIFNKTFPPENKTIQNHFNSYNDIINFFLDFKPNTISNNFLKLLKGLHILYEKNNQNENIKKAIEHLQGTLFFNIFNENFFFVPFLFYYNNSWEEIFFRFNKKQSKKDNIYSLNILLKPNYNTNLLLNFILYKYNNYFDLKFSSNNKLFLKQIEENKQKLLYSFKSFKPKLRNIHLYYDTKNIENNFFYMNIDTITTQIVDYIV